MAKRSPIASRNRTQLFIKKLFKFRIFKQKRLASKGKSKNSNPLLENFLKTQLKKFGGWYLWWSRVSTKSPSSAKIEKTKSTPKPLKPSRLSSQRTVFRINSPLNGWSLFDLWSSLEIPSWWPEFEWPQLKLPFKISTPQLPQTPSPRLSFKLSLSHRRRLILVGVVVLLVTGATTYQFVLKDLPHPTELRDGHQNLTTRILSRDGDVLFRIYEDENRTLTSLDNIPQHMKDATIAIEDKNFYQHHGFSIRGIIRAAITNTQEDEITQGGSTITQQLVKNRLLTPEKTIQRKLRELVLSVWTETQYSKDEILEMYFNQVAYGGATYGVEEAAQRYFGKSVSQLDLAESAMLAGLPQAPSVYSPFGSTPDLAKQRQLEVLRRMVEDHYISQEQADEAFREQLVYRQDVIDIQAPHFVMYVRKLLAEQYGEAVVAQGGLEVTTTLDLALQNEAQEIVTDEVDALARLRVSNGAALITHPKTGEILAMIGSKDYFDFEHDGQVNVTISPRQPGSSIKPLTYALALSNGKSPGTIIDDSPVVYQTLGSPPYSPKNYDGKFHGKVTLREALASSYNVPAVKTLAEVGVLNMIDRGEDMGIDTWQDKSRFGLSLTLGGGEVTMADMTELYSTFANYGQTVELNPILEVRDAHGETLYRNTCALDNRGCPVTNNLTAAVAYQITDILSDNQARTPAFGPFSVLSIPGQEVAVKTGTTNNLRDNWTIGYTTDYLVAAWVGNNDNTPMSYVASGITGASPIWNKLIRLTLSEDDPHIFPVPDELVEVEICAKTGTLTCTGCPQTTTELFVVGTEPTQRCSAEWFEEKDEAESAENANRDQLLQGANF